MGMLTYNQSIIKWECERVEQAAELRLIISQVDAPRQTAYDADSWAHSCWVEALGWLSWYWGDAGHSQLLEKAGHPGGQSQTSAA